MGSDSSVINDSVRSQLQPGHSSLFADAYHSLRKSVGENPCAYGIGAALAGAGLFYLTRGRCTAALPEVEATASTVARVAEEPVATVMRVADAPVANPSLISLDSAIQKLQAGVEPPFGKIEMPKSGGSIEVPGIFHEFQHETILPDPLQALEQAGMKSEPLKLIAGDANEAPARSMGPLAYKVLREGGISDFDPWTKYPLPTQLATGEWRPGSWVEPGDSTLVKSIQTACSGRKGLYVTSNPKMWGATKDAMETYEVEIGDSASRSQWESAIHPALRIDFTANRIRLLRRIPAQELAKIQTTDSDFLGLGIWRKGMFEEIARQFPKLSDLD
jgi:hypothetical protein